ncbi:MAG TPA: 4Fe-4S dicluster domain-containing protein [Candidatus Lokiarchaeia archaeon]|nr:4Fe-4S dicluster domain-containing protein [Candidatus Lokiarchaeia archaeon]
MSEEEPEDRIEKKDPAFEFFEKVTKFKLVSSDIIKCLSCGRCTGYCPASRVSDYNIRHIINRVLDGDTSVLTDPLIWQCFLCATCVTKCPEEGLSPPEVIQNLREYALNKGYGAWAVAHLIPAVENFFKYGTVVKGIFPVSDQAIEEINTLGELTGMKHILEKRKKLVEESKT